MQEHYNLYYLLLEDKEKHPLPAQQSERIQKNIEKILQRNKTFPEATTPYNQRAEAQTIFQ